MKWDVVIVGAGAAGLLGAARVAEQGRRVLLLEKNRKPGAKILMSGGTRCNLTQHTDARGIVEAFGKQGPFLHSALAALDPAKLVALLNAEGVATKVEETGKVFPVSDRAGDVLAALLSRLRRSGCELALEEPLLELTRGAEGFQLATPRRVIEAQNVIVTTGGQSYPGCGTTGDGYRWLAGLGHRIVPPRPALTPITTNASWVASLRGVTIPDVHVRVVLAEEEKTRHDRAAVSASKASCLAQARDSFLFTHFGLSGPAVLDVSGAVTRWAAEARPASASPSAFGLDLQCDFLPALSCDQLQQQLRRLFADEGKKLIAAVLARQLPRRLADALVEQLGFSHTRGAEVSKKQLQQLMMAVKHNRIRISGTRGFKKAEVTAGGVALSEIDSRSMQSKITPNLYLAGEILDLDGPIGGYNFQAAFSTAWLAGSRV